MKFSSIKSFCRKKMLTVYITLVGIFLQARQVQLQLDNCLQKTTSCPESKQRWERRSKEFNCTQKDTNYTCLLTKTGQLVETCIFKIKVHKGVVGCPFIMPCLDGLPHVGTENNYMECPEHIRWCPPKDHEAYTLFEMYKYPACFYHNKSEAINIIPPDTETTVPISQTTYRIATAESHTTQGSFPVFIVVIIAIIVLLVIVIAAVIVWFKRCRKQLSPFPEDGEGLPLMDPRKERYSKFQNDLYGKNNERTKKIPIPSLRRATKLHIDNLYSSVVVRRHKSHQETKGIKEREVEQRVEHPRDIFYIGDKRTRYAFMIGLPARGKTAYCQWLTHKWCRAKEKRQEQEDLDEWEKGLNEFDFLFFVKLRDISKADSVSDIIYSDLFSNDSDSRNFINEILDSDDSRCLIIFDGLDELKSDCTLPDMDKMPNCTFFISTRPWNTNLIDDNDKVLEIKGLDENGIKNVTESLLCHHYKLSKDSGEYVRLNDIITRKSRIGAIKTFMHIPLLAITCVQVLYEHRDEGDIGTNITDFYMDMIDLLIKRAREKEHIHYDSDVVGCSEFAELLKYRHTNLYQYSEVLMRLAELAFEGLTGKKDKLVMNEDELLRQISRNHLQFALDVGLLSQSDENAYFNKVKVSISFFHKTVQEAFTAMHIAVNIKDKFTNYLTNVKEILEYSYVIMFISGLKPDLGRYMLQHITDVLDKDAKISEYRSELLDTTDRSDISSLFKLQVDCFREIHYKIKATEEDKTNTETAIPSEQSYLVSDVMLEDYDDDFISDTAELLGHHLPTLKSAYFLRVPSRGKNGIDDALITKFLDNTKTLKSLFISGFEQGRILHHIHVTELTVLSLMYVSISDVNPVDETYSLQPLLTNMPSLQILKLNHVTVGNKDLGINAEFRQLKKIVLQWVKMSLWDRFFRSLTEVQHRYEVKLSYSDADDLSMEKLYKSPHFQITWYGGKARTHFYRIKQTLH